MTYEIKKAKVIPSSSASMKTPIADKLIKAQALAAERNIRDKAIRECIAVVEHLHDHEAPHDAHRDALWNAIIALRALLEATDAPPPLPPSVGIPEKKGSLW